MSAEWKRRREGGGRLAIRLFRACAGGVGRRVARMLLLPITLYFVLRRGAERRDSRAYLSRVLGRPATLRDAARHIHTFAATTLDRYFLLSEEFERFDFTVKGVDALHQHIAAGRGVLLFGSHLGSFEALRALARQRPDYRIKVVLDRAHSAAVTQALDAINPEIAATVIDAGQPGPAIMFEIQQAAREGAMIALLVDRAQPGEAVERVPFLGDPAAFPVAPWQVAAVLGIPVMLAFGLYRGGNRYDLVFEPFSDGIRLPRRERAAGIPALIRRYAARLEHHVHDAPWNWFNFYDFWNNDDAGSDVETPRTRDRHGGDAAGPARAIVGDGAGSGR